MIDFKPVKTNTINKYKKQAEKEGLCFCDDTKYWGFYTEEEMVGFAGLLIYKNKAIDKNIFIFDEHRGKGYFKKWLDWRDKYLKVNEIKVIEATCTKKSLPEYIKRGFKIVKKYSSCTKVRYENI